MLTGRRPYGTKPTDVAVIAALLRDELPSETEDLPIDAPDLKLLLKKCWSIQPTERPSATYCLDILNSASSVLDNPTAGYNPTAFDTKPASVCLDDCPRDTWAG